MKNKIFKKLLRPYILKRIYMERLGEPVIYNIVSIFIYLFIWELQGKGEV